MIEILALPPAKLAIWAASFAMAIYGVRYVVIASFAYLIAHPARQRGLGRPHENVPASFNSKLHVRRELAFSALTVLMFGLVNAVLYGCGLLKFSLLYLNPLDYPMWWFWLSVPAMLVLHDTFFYWLHRAMHSPLLFKTMHRVHHQSLHPTAFAAYSFHPTEAFAEAMIVTAIIYVIPVHPLPFLIFQTLSTAYNVYGHCGREFYPKGTASHWLGRWINTSTAHSYHHLKGRKNYGLYFMFWDRVMSTVGPDSSSVPDASAKRPTPTATELGAG